MNVFKQKKFLEIAKANGELSKDIHAKVGAIILDKYNRTVSTGYNGFPKDTPDNWMNFMRPSKGYCILHAEENAILFAKTDISNCTMIVTHAPCEKCLKLISQAGIKKVYYADISLMNRRLSKSKYVFLTIRKLLKFNQIDCFNIDNGKSYVEELGEISKESQLYDQIYDISEIQEDTEYIYLSESDYLKSKNENLIDKFLNLFKNNDENELIKKNIFEKKLGQLCIKQNGELQDQYGRKLLVEKGWFYKI